MNNDKQKPSPDDDVKIIVEGHILIRDKETGQVLVNKRG